MPRHALLAVVLGIVAGAMSCSDRAAPDGTEDGGHTSSQATSAADAGAPTTGDAGDSGGSTADDPGLPDPSEAKAHGLGGDPVLCGVTLSPGGDTLVAGSVAGRAVFGVEGALRVVEVGANCSAELGPLLAIAAKGLRMAGDGSLLAAHERFALVDFGHQRDGMRFYGLPAVTLLGQHQVDLISEWIREMDVDDAGTRWSRMSHDSADPLIDAGEVAGPWEPPYLGFGVQSPRLAPDGLHYVVGRSRYSFETFARHTTIYGLDKKLVALEGAPVGFLDNEHILFNRYDEESDDFSGAVIIDLAGDTVNTTELPELTELFRLGTGEILGRRTQDERWAVFEPSTGAVLWTAGEGAQVALVGTNQLIGLVEGRVELVRWR